MRIHDYYWEDTDQREMFDSREVECCECGCEIDPYEDAVVCVGNAFYCSTTCWEK